MAGALITGKLRFDGLDGACHLCPKAHRLGVRQPWHRWHWTGAPNRGELGPGTT